MKLHELISESISLTKLKHPLTDAIVSKLVDSARHMSSKQRTIAPEVKADAIASVSLNRVHEQVSKWLLPDMMERVSAAIEYVADAHLPDAVPVMFDPDLSADGAAHRDRIFLSPRLLEPIRDAILTRVIENTLDDLPSEEALYTEYFATFRQIDKAFFQTSEFVPHIFQLVSVVIHELVHVQQHEPQKDRAQTEYRSYLEKDRSKFVSAVKSISATDSVRNSSYKLYRASPQEIAAFAQESALRFIHNAEIDLPDDPAAMRAVLPDQIKWYMTDMFTDPSNHKEYAVFKRFNKLMYQEVIRYIEDMERKHRRAKRRQA